ncbi:MAG TPA: FAD-dependent oxidoreductase [Thermoanaerobaculia bacterium]|nr:FAD-dependent oxidoreductase [Thermoanaerobaculia bacterium]
MSGEQQLTGPDLAQGVALADLAPEGMLLGHAHGEAVLLARVGDEVFAVAAACTHYGGPLADGLRVGDTVRCPWHHACFSLRTGEALRAPALNPLARYRVERRGDKVVVGEKLGAEGGAPEDRAGREAAAVQAPRSAVVHAVGAPRSIVIIGAGAAGNAAAERLRRIGYDGGITMLGGDDSVPYDRPNLSKDYLAGTAPEEWIPLRPAEFYAEQRIELRLGTRARAIDPERRTVELADGGTLGYGALLLATGAEPVTLEQPGSRLPHVHYLRTLADSRGIIANAGKARRAVVVGASFIGLEVAASLRARQLEVTVVAPEARPLERVLGPQVGDFLRGLHEQHGVAFRLGQTVREITADAVTTAAGERLPAELVVIGIGVRPAVELAAAAGLEMDKGVLVDRHLETSKPGIFAAGDIARWPDPHSGSRIRVEHWVVAERQGQTVAENLLGRRVPFDAVPFFWSQHYDVTINYLGHAESWDAIDVDGSLEQRDATVTFRSQGAVRAVATLFRDRRSLAVEAALESGDQAALSAALSG